MAFSLTANPINILPISLTDGNPFRLENADILESAPIIRHQQRSPLQNSMSDLGFRLQPQEIRLDILFTATTDAALDGYRDDLMAVFSPYYTVILSATLDNGSVRTLSCKPVGEVAIDLVPEHRPGRLHRATVTLSAPSPLWKANSNTIGTATYATLLGEWWTAGGTVGTAQIKTHVNSPTYGGQAWQAFGSIDGNWAVAVVTPYGGQATDQFSRVIWDTIGTSIHNRMFFQVGTAAYPAGGGTVFSFGQSDAFGGVGWPGGSAPNYHVIHQNLDIGAGSVLWKYWDGSGIGTSEPTYASTAILLGTGSWGSAYGSAGFHSWDEQIQKAMIWENPTDVQIAALAQFMLGTLIPNSVNIVNTGDVSEYPSIQLRGPMINPMIINDTVGGTVDLTGVTIPSGQTYTLDLSNGNKQLYDSGGTSHMGEITVNPLGMADFMVAPDPVAPGGTNTITILPGSAGSAAYMTVQITDRFVGL